MLEWLQLLWQPVALVGWALLVVAWLAWRTEASASGRWIATSLAAFYFVVATPLGANLPVGVLEAIETPASRACAAPTPARAIVVLAGGMSGVPASRDDFARLHVESLRRVIESLRLARSIGDVRLVVSGGGGAEIREADLMASLATDLGFPPGRLRVERESRTTAEAARSVARLLAAERGPAGPVYLVTSAMHMPRAAASFRRQGVEVCPVPVDRRWVRPDLYWGLVPQITALDKSTVAGHEALGYLVYWTTGRL